MDIQRKAFESSNNVNPDWSFKFDEELQQYVATDFEMTNQVDEFNEHWDTFRAGWEAKAQAVPEGFVLVSSRDLLDLTVMINQIDLLTIGKRPAEVSYHMVSVGTRILEIIEAQEPTHD